MSYIYEIDVQRTVDMILGNGNLKWGPENTKLFETYFEIKERSPFFWNSKLPWPREKWIWIQPCDYNFYNILLS